MDSIGRYLKRTREGRAMSVEEVSRATRIPVASIDKIEADHFDDLPGEVFVRGFLKAYARAVSLSVDDVLARYTASRRVAWVTPLPISAPDRRSTGKRFGVAIAFVVLLILFTLALSIVLRPRHYDAPPELSRLGHDGGSALGHDGGSAPEPRPRRDSCLTAPVRSVPVDA
jgi:cytoskeletal protein RodZ